MQSPLPLAPPPFPSSASHRVRTEEQKRRAAARRRERAAQRTEAERQAFLDRHSDQEWMRRQLFSEEEAEAERARQRDRQRQRRACMSEEEKKEEREYARRWRRRVREAAKAARRAGCPILPMNVFSWWARGCPMGKTLPTLWRDMEHRPSVASNDEIKWDDSVECEW